MPNLNRVLLMGNLTRDPELRYLPSNVPVVNIGLAINRKWRDPQGEQKEEVVFVDCEGFGRTAELINQYMKKGRPLFVEGRLRLDQWQDKEGGGARSRMKVVIESFQFVDSRGGDPAGAGDHDGDHGSGPGPASGGGAPSGGGGGYSRPRGNYPARGGGSGPGPGSGGGNAPPPADTGNAGHQPVPKDDIPF